MAFSPEYLVGVALSLTSTVVQNGALGCMKLVHLAEERKPVAARRPYYRIPRWYGVFVFNVIGVVLDFVALSFLPSSVAMPIGSLGLVVSTAFAWRFAGEVLTLGDVLGVVCIVVGSWVSVLFSGGSQCPRTAPEFLELLSYGSVSFVYLLLVLALVLTAVEAHKGLGRNPLIGAAIPGLMGTLTNIGGKGSSNILVLTLSGRSQLGYLFSYVLVLATGVSVLIQNDALQKALSNYDQVIVVPIYFVTMCIGCVFNGLFFFDEFHQTSATSNAVFALGILCIVVGAGLLAQKHMKRTVLLTEEDEGCGNNNNNKSKKNELNATSITSPQDTKRFFTPPIPQSNKNKKVKKISETATPSSEILVSEVNIL